jgi:hypothetical protein
MSRVRAVDPHAVRARSDVVVLLGRFAVLRPVGGEAVPEVKPALAETHADERSLQRHPELPKAKFELAMHELHQALVIRLLPDALNDVRDATNVHAGE